MMNVTVTRVFNPCLAAFRLDNRTLFDPDRNPARVSPNNSIEPRIPRMTQIIQCIDRICELRNLFLLIDQRIVRNLLSVFNIRAIRVIRGE